MPVALAPLDALELWPLVVMFIHVVGGFLLLAARSVSLRAPRAVPLARPTTSCEAVSAGEATVPKRKVALLVEPTPFTHVSGYANRFQEMLKHLERSGDEVRVATPDDVADAPASFGAFPVTTLPGFRFRPWYPEICLSMDLTGAALEMIRDLDPDVVHASSPGFLAVAAASYARKLGKPLVLSYHTHIPIYVRRYAGWVPFIEQTTWALLRAVHNRADLTVATSPQIRDELAANGILRVGVWNKGIDTETFHPRYRSPEARHRLTDGHPEAPLAVYVGRLGVEKRIDELRDVLDAIPDLRLALVGKGPAEAALRDAFADVADRVVFTGLLRGDDLSAAFASADVFLMPSDSETLGFVVLESMASGVPVVGCRAGGIPNLIDDGKTGFLHAVSDTAAIAKLAKALIDDPDTRAAVGRAAREEAEKWDWASSGETLRADSYAEAIRNFHARQQ